MFILFRPIEVAQLKWKSFIFYFLFKQIPADGTEKYIFFQYY